MTWVAVVEIVCSGLFHGTTAADGLGCCCGGVIDYTIVCFDQSYPLWTNGRIDGHT